MRELEPPTFRLTAERAKQLRHRDSKLQTNIYDWKIVFDYRFDHNFIDVLIFPTLACLDSSVGRALDWRTKVPGSIPGQGGFANSYHILTHVFNKNQNF